METLIGIVLVAAAGYGVMRYLKSRAKAEAERKARAAKRAKIARADAKAFQETLANRR